jgi:hypothetical protein
LNKIDEIFSWLGENFSPGEKPFFFASKVQHFYKRISCGKFEKENTNVCNDLNGFFCV